MPELANGFAGSGLLQALEIDFNGLATKDTRGGIARDWCLADIEVNYMATPKLDFGRSMRRRRAHFPCAARYGAGFLHCPGAAGT